MDKFSQYYKSTGKFLSSAMFKEMHDHRGGYEEYTPIYTLKTQDIPDLGLESAYKIYMESADEYEAALKICPTYADWDKMANSSWFVKPNPHRGHIGLEAWREHMRLRDASLAKNQLIEQTQDGNVTAAKALLQETKVKKGAGRPVKKAEPAGQLALVKDFKQKQEARKA
jgi:hypothetical protein